MTDLELTNGTTHVRIQKPDNDLANELIKMLTAEERTAALIFAGQVKRDRIANAKDKGDHAMDAGKQFVFFSYIEMISDKLPPHQIETVLHGHIKAAKLAIKQKKDVIYNQGILTAAIDHLKKLATYEQELSDNGSDSKPLVRCSACGAKLIREGNLLYCSHCSTEYEG